MVIDACEIDARVGGDVAHRDILEAAQGKQPFGRHQDRRLGGGFMVGVRHIGEIGRGFGH